MESEVRGVIETGEYAGIPATVFQRVTGEITSEEIERGAAAANVLIRKVIEKHGTFNLIVDARGIGFKDLAAHRTWKLTAEKYPDIVNKMKYLALVFTDSQNVRLEKEFMETETQKFFFDIDEALAWLKETVWITR